MTFGLVDASYSLPKINGKLYKCLPWHLATHVLIHWMDPLPVSSQELLTAVQGVIGLILGAGPILRNEDTAFATPLCGSEDHIKGSSHLQ